MDKQISGNVSSEAKASGDGILTAEEAAVYDRQIRLWGVEAQQRLRKARVLIVGLNGLGNEVCKNILLAGIKHLTMLDGCLLTEEECSSQFLAPYDAVGKPKAAACLARARELNPMVDIVADTGDVSSKEEGYFANFDVVCVTGCSAELQLRVNDICHRLGLKFLSGNVFGYYGYMFADLGTHEFVEEKAKIAVHKTTEPPCKKAKMDEGKDQEMEQKVSEFCSLREALDSNILEGATVSKMKQTSKAYLVMHVLHAYCRKYGEYPKEISSNEQLSQLLDVRGDVLERLRLDNDMLPDEFSSLCIGEVYPVNAIVGGVFAQEVIKAVSGKDPPHNNFFFYDGDATSGVVLRVAPSIAASADRSAAEIIA